MHKCLIWVKYNITMHCRDNHRFARDSCHLHKIELSKRKDVWKMRLLPYCFNVKWRIWKNSAVKQRYFVLKYFEFVSSNGNTESKRCPWCHLPMCDIDQKLWSFKYAMMKIDESSKFRILPTPVNPPILPRVPTMKVKHLHYRQ